MKIRLLYIFLSIIFFNRELVAQQFEWVQSNVVNYSLNPGYPDFAMAYSESTHQVVDARLTDVNYIYGSTLLGNFEIEGRDTTGQLLWSYALGDSVSVQRIVADANGDIYVAGLFQQTMHLGANDSLVFITGTFIFQNTFVIKLNSAGTLLWKRNVTTTWPDYEGVQALAIDPNDNCWMAMTNFFVAAIVQMDANGNDMTVHQVENCKTIGNISFDPSGGMFISGAASNGDFIMDTDTFIVTEPYNMFIARFYPSGAPAWAYFGHDITFQKPVVIADNAGNAFMAGTRYDTTSFNGMFFWQPYLFGDFFALKIDSSGTVQWGLQQPLLGIGPYGIFEPGSNLCVAADNDGNYYLGGRQRGPVDWGNGFISSTPTLNEYNISIVKIDPAGKVQWDKLGGGTTYNSYLHAIDVSETGSVYFTGAFGDTAMFDAIQIPTTNFYNFAVGKIGYSATGVDELQNGEVMSVYPNPVSDIVHFDAQLMGYKLEIYDFTGRLVQYTNKVRVNFVNVASLAPGCYSFRFSNGKDVKQFVVSRVE